MKTKSRFAIKTALGLALLAVTLSPLFGGTHSAQSGVITVDTRDAALAVSGRVLHAVTRAPLAGATVTLAGQNATTSGSGGYSFASVSLASGNTLAVSKTAFATNQTTVAPPGGATTYSAPDVYLSPVGQLRVTSIKPKYDGLFPSGASFLNEYTATVSWGGRTPSRVEFYVNGSLARTVSTPTEEATAELDMGLGFVGTLNVGGNKVRAVAVDSLGERSAAFEQNVTILPMPLFLVDQGIMLPFTLVFGQGNDHPMLSWEFNFPRSFVAARDVRDLPFIGRFGPDFNFDMAFDYDLLQGEWGLFAGKKWDKRLHSRSGARPRTPRFYFGNVDFEYGFGGVAEGVASQTRAIVVERLGVELSAGVRVEVLTFYFTDYVPGGQIIRLLDKLKRIGLDVNSIQRVRLFGLFDASFSAMANLQPFGFADATLSLQPGVEAFYEPSVGVAHGSIAVGGNVGFDLQLAPAFGFEKITAAIYMKLHFDALLMEPYDATFYILNRTLYERAAKAGKSGFAGSEIIELVSEDAVWVVCKAKSVSNGTIRRDYRKWGEERFVAGGGGSRAASATGPLALDSFRLLSQAPVEGSVVAEARSADILGRLGASAGSKADKNVGAPKSGVSQADLALVQNAFPNSQPAMAGLSNELMLLYVTDNGSSNNLQFTDIKWTRWNGTNWSAPLAIRTNTQAEFSPQVKFDGNGNALAVWERVANPNFTNVDLTAMAAQMEVVWSRWSRTNGAWTEPAAMTANSYLDHAPLLCGPLVSGDLLAVWTANPANLLMGTNGPGADQILWSRWAAGTRSWTAPQTLLSGVAYRLSQSLAGADGRAVYAWTRDVDGVLTNDLDQEVFYCEWTNGAWGAVKQFATNAVADKNVRAAVATNGTAYLVWQSGTNLVLSQNFATNVTVARPDSQTAGFADYALTLGPLGHLVLLWQEMSTNGSDAHIGVYDPASRTWSKDILLCNDSSLERSFASVWDNVGNLTVAYNKVEMLYTNKTVTLEGGGTITITNVPQPGRVDLVVTKRALVKDLALLAGDFTVDGVNWLPGDPLTITALVRNVGDVAVSNVVVGFYDGNPVAGGTLITNVTLPGWLEGAGTNTASALWIVPEPAAPHTLYAVVDRTNAVTEYNESNNVQSVSIGGTDLAVSLVSYRGETNGAVRVIAQVQNLGAPTATNTTMGIRRNGETAVLATNAIPALEPGRLAQVALDLPPGTQAEGETIYQLTADETHAAPDVNTNNNTASFAVNLWVDSDGDGMPDGWEIANGFSTTNAVDAALDFDGDGMSNLAEYRAGTSPTNAQSYLRIESVRVGGTNGVQVAWGSTSNRLYSVLRASLLVTNGSAFTNLAEHLLSTPPQNVFFDATATNASRFFYRIKVE